MVLRRPLLLVPFFHPAAVLYKPRCTIAQAKFHNVKNEGTMIRRARGVQRRAGTQTLERTVRLLNFITMRPRFGWRLSDLAEYSEISKGTAHRLLAFLVRERLVQRRTIDRHYLPGPLLFEFSLALPSFAQFIGACNAPLRRLARGTGMVAYLFLRSGSEFVCAARYGTTALKALSIEVGTRRALLSTAGGIAILIALEEAEREKAVERNLNDMKRFGPHRIKALQTVFRESKKHGFGLHQGQIVPDVHSLGLAIRNRHGVPFAALSLVGAAEKLPPSRVGQFVALLKEEADVVARAALEYGVTEDQSGTSGRQVDGQALSHSY
jgi:DNA-binding IclR family transcriptional regulator